MTKDQAKPILYNAVYTAIHIPQEPAMDDFYKMTVDDTVANYPGSTPNPDDWWDLLADTIRDGFNAFGWYINIQNFDQWLKNNANSTWDKVLDGIGSKLVEK